MGRGGSLILPFVSFPWLCPGRTTTNNNRLNMSRVAFDWDVGHRTSFLLSLTKQNKNEKELLRVPPDIGATRICHFQSDYGRADLNIYTPKTKSSSSPLFQDVQSYARLGNLVSMRVGWGGFSGFNPSSFSTGSLFFFLNFKATRSSAAIRARNSFPREVERRRSWLPWPATFDTYPVLLNRPRAIKIETKNKRRKTYTHTHTPRNANRSISRGLHVSLSLSSST